MENTFIQMLYPIHPKLVHFPIALMVSAMGMQALGVFFKKDPWCKCAWLMFILAVLSMPIVILSGLLEVNRLHLRHPVLNFHRLAAFWTVGISWISLPFLWFMRNKENFSIMFLILLIIISGLLGLTSHQGGRMVYEYGAGVNQ
ncbi:MAG: DUF2231 domain-containing protein [Candidatus Omnitrophica bacterium]|nr:DUF2231 domain-containing protein [Candidatus Omnitrophota bacterium]